MTPLAAYLMKQVLARPKHREGIWRDPAILSDLRTLIEGVHCFEVTACWPLMVDLLSKINNDIAAYYQMFDKFGFLPAPKTWLEWKIEDRTSARYGARRGVCLTQYPKLVEIDGVMRETVAINLLEHQNAVCVGAVVPSTGQFRLNEAAEGYPAGFDPQKIARSLVGVVQTMLILINSPRIIGRRQHMPNAGLERRLTRGLGAGKFPLHAWTEILLEVSKPTDIDDGELHEAHLTGRRALHFCRKHIRIRNGQLEYVRAHWRGDPALGIKRSRYTVTA